MFASETSSRLAFKPDLTGGYDRSVVEAGPDGGRPEVSAGKAEWRDPRVEHDRRAFAALTPRVAAGPGAPAERDVLAGPAHARSRSSSRSGACRLILEHDRAATLMGAYGFAWGFGFFQFLLEFGMSSALQRQISETLDAGRPRGGRPGDRLRDDLLRRVAVVQVAALLAVAALRPARHSGSARRIVPPDRPAPLAPGGDGPLLRAHRRSSPASSRRRGGTTSSRGWSSGSSSSGSWSCWAGLTAGVDFFRDRGWRRRSLQIGLSLGPALWVMVRELGHVPHFRGARRDDYTGLVRTSASTCP